MSECIYYETGITLTADTKSAPKQRSPYCKHELSKHPKDDSKSKNILDCNDDWRRCPLGITQEESLS